MHGYRPAPSQQDARGGIWAVALVLFLLAPRLADATPASLTAAVAPRPSVTPTPDGRAGAKAVRYAVAQQGKPYRWGAEGPSSFDCSGLTWAAWRAAGRTIPRTAAGQLTNLPRVHGKLRPGDLVIYATDGPSRRHVVMVVAPRRVVEARGHGIPVRVTRLRPGWLGAVRP